MYRALLCLPLLAALGQAQELRWGLHALGSTFGKDLGKLTDDATGFGLGLHAFISAGAAEALRIRLEGQVFPGKELSGIKAQVYEGAITADWLHYFSGRTESGPYTVLSAGFSRWRTDFQDTGDAIPSEDKNSFLASAGVGMQLDRTFGLEASAWRIDRFRQDQGKAQGLTAMLTIRF